MQKMIEQELLQQATDKWAEIKNKDPNELIKSLDIISELLLHPKLTLKIAESLRPILIDLVSRWSLQLNIDNYNNTKSNQLFSNKEYFLRIEKVALAFTQLLPITPQLLSIVYNMSVTQQEIALEYWTCSSKSHHIINYLELENGEIIDVRMLRLFDEISNAKKQHSLLLDCENNNNNVFSISLSYLNNSDLSPATINICDTTKLNLHSICLALSMNSPILLEGVTGSGKTTLVEELAYLTGHGEDLIKIHLGDQTDSKVLLGTYVSTSTPASFRWQPGVLNTAVSKGRWVLIEDIDFAPNDVISVILPLLETRQLFIPNRGEKIKAHPNFHLFATKSLIPVGMKKSSNSINSNIETNLWTRITINPLTSNELKYVIKNQFFKNLDNQNIIEILHSLITYYQNSSPASPIISQTDTSDLQAESPPPPPPTLISFTSNFARYISIRDLMKWCRRSELLLRSKNIFSTNQLISNTHYDINDIRNDLFSEAADCFCAMISDFDAWINSLLKLGDVLGITAERVHYYVNSYVPNLYITNDHIIIGRAKLISLDSKKEKYLKYAINHKKIFANTGHSLRLMEQIAVCVNLKEPVLLVGETGTGKTTVIQHLADMLNQNLVVVNLSQQTDSSDLLGGFKPVDVRILAIPLKDEFDKLFEKTFSIKRNPNFLEAVRKVFTSKKYTNFVEGSLVKAVKNGDWILLDEVNLASTETLECLSGLLQDSNSSILLTEKGDSEPIKRHPNFRVFACMNPATDVGKRDLPPGLRNRFTEFYVHPIDNRFDDLMIIVKQYLSDYITSKDERIFNDIVEFYIAVKDLENQHKIVDGANQRPHFSMRTLTRALRYVTQIIQTYGLRRSIYEGFCMTFLTQLNGESVVVLEGLIEKYLLKDVQNPKSLIKQIPKQPSSDNNYVLFGCFWLSLGNYPPEEMPHYILTPSIKRSLNNLARVLMSKKFPVLLQGPTSAGKTSMIQYLAKCTGHRFVRINNHEHTDLQEYLGTYVSNSEGKLEFQEGILVEALKNGYWIVLDELNLAPTDVMEALNRLLDDNRELLIPETNEIVKPHKDFMLFATQNPPGLYGGRKILSRAFRNRFMELHFDDIPEGELETILSERCSIAPSYCKKLVMVYKQLIERRQGTRIFEQKHGYITLRDLFRWAERCAIGYQELAEQGYMLLAERIRIPEEKAIVKQVLETVMKVKIDENQMYDCSKLDEFQKFNLIQNTSDRINNNDMMVWTKAMKRLFTLVANCLKFNEPVLLVGETGCGKTTICQVLAEIYGSQIHIVNCHHSTETADLLGGQRPLRNKGILSAELKNDLSEYLLKYALENNIDLKKMELKNLIELFEILRCKQLNTLFEWHDGPLIQAMKNGEFFLLDEISLADDSVIERLNSVLEPSRILVLPEKGGEQIEELVAKPGFQFLATMNPGGDYGKKELSPALRNRFTEIWVPSVIDNEDLIQIIDSKLNHNNSLKGYAQRILNFVDWLKHSLGSNLITTSLRDILTWVLFMNSTVESIGAERSFIHGGFLVFIDGLGSNSTSGSFSSGLNLKDFRVKCLKKLVELIDDSEFSNIYFNNDFIDAKKLSSTENVFGIHPFFIPKGSLDTRPISFTLQASTTMNNTLRILRAMQAKKPILLEGSPGVGKTSLVSALAAATGHKLIRINLSDQTDLMDLFGSDLPVEGGDNCEFAWRDAPFLQAMKTGDWILLDELNLASQSVLEGLNSCLDHRGTVYIPELDKEFSCSREFRVFGAQNPFHQGGGRKGLPKSFTNRFTQVYIEHLTKDDMLFISKYLFPRINCKTLEKIIDFNNRVYQDSMIECVFGRNGSPWEFNLRDVFRWLDLLNKDQGFGYNSEPEDYLDLLYLQKMRTKEDRDHIILIFNEIFDKNIKHPRRPHYHIDSKFFQVGHSILKRRCFISNTKFLEIPLHIFQSQMRPFQALMKCVEMNWMVILTGPESSGKTSLIRLLADLTGNTLEEFTMNSSVDTAELLGGFEQLDLARHRLLAMEQLNSICNEIIKCILTLCQTNTSNVGNDKLIQIIQKLNDMIFTLESNYKFNTGISQKNSSPALSKRHIDYTIVDQLIESIRKATADLHYLSSTYPIDFQHMLDSIQTQIDKIKTLESETVKGHFEWIDGILINALEKGHWLLIDNANVCSPSVLDRLNSLLEPNGVIVLNERGLIDGEVKVYKPHKDFRIFMTVNPRNGELSQAMRNRGVEISLLGSEFIENKQDLIKLFNGYGLRSDNLILFIDKYLQSMKEKSSATTSLLKNNLGSYMALTNFILERLQRGENFSSALKNTFDQFGVIIDEKDFSEILSISHYINNEKSILSETGYLSNSPLFVGGGLLKEEPSLAMICIQGSYLLHQLCKQELLTADVVGLSQKLLVACDYFVEHFSMEDVSLRLCWLDFILSMFKSTDLFELISTHIEYVKFMIHSLANHSRTPILIDFKNQLSNLIKVDQTFMNCLSLDITNNPTIHKLFSNLTKTTLHNYANSEMILNVWEEYSSNIKSLSLSKRVNQEEFLENIVYKNASKIKVSKMSLAEQSYCYNQGNIGETQICHKIISFIYPILQQLKNVVKSRIENGNCGELEISAINDLLDMRDFLWEYLSAQVLDLGKFHIYIKMIYKAVENFRDKVDSAQHLIDILDHIIKDETLKTGMFMSTIWHRFHHITFSKIELFQLEQELIKIGKEFEISEENHGSESIELFNTIKKLPEHIRNKILDSNMMQKIDNQPIVNLSFQDQKTNQMNSIIDYSSMIQEMQILQMLQFATSEKTYLNNDKFCEILIKIGEFCDYFIKNGTRPPLDFASHQQIIWIYGKGSNVPSEKAKSILNNFVQDVLYGWHNRLWRLTYDLYLMDSGFNDDVYMKHTLGPARLYQSVFVNYFFEFTFNIQSMAVCNYNENLNLIEKFRKIISKKLFFKVKRCDIDITLLLLYLKQFDKIIELTNRTFLLDQDDVKFDANINATEAIEMLVIVISDLEKIDDLSFSSTLQRWFIPAIQSIIQYLNKYDNVDLIELIRMDIGKAWIFVALGFMELYIPNYAFDPTAEPHIFCDFLHHKQAKLEIEILARSEIEKWYNGESSNMIIDNCKNELERIKLLLKDNSANLTLRPETSQLNDLFNQIHYLCNNVIDSFHVLDLLKNLEGNLNEISILQREVLFQDKCMQFIQRMSTNYPLYQDLLQPIFVAIFQLKYGFRLMASANKVLKSTNDNLIYKVLKTLITMTQSGFQHDDVLMLASPESLTNVKNLMFSQNLSSRDKWNNYLEYLTIIVKCIYKHAAKHGYLTLKIFDTLQEVLCEISDIYLAAEEQKIKLAQEGENLYKTKTKNNSFATDEQLSEIELKQMFPDYIHEYFDVDDDVNNNDINNNDNSNNETLPMEDLNNDILIEVGTIYQTFFNDFSHTSYCLKIKNQRQSTKKIFWESFIMARSIAKACGKLFPEDLDDDIDTVQVFGTSILKEWLIHEAKKLGPIVSNLQQAIKKLLKMWPEHAILQQIDNLCSRINGFSLDSPLAKLLTGLEILLQKSDEWEVFASREVSIKSHQQEITQLIIHWRQLELTCWSKLLTAQETYYKKSAYKWWFHLYNSIIHPIDEFADKYDGLEEECDEGEREINDDGDFGKHITGIVSALDQFLQSSNIGDFEARLELLYSFYQHLSLKVYFIKKNSDKIITRRLSYYNTTADTILNVFKYYSQFLSHRNATLKTLCKPIEKELKEFVKIASWKDVNIYALKQSAAKTHRQLSKCIKKYKIILDKSIKDIIFDYQAKNFESEARVSETVENDSIDLKSTIQPLTSSSPNIDNLITIIYSQIPNLSDRFIKLDQTLKKLHSYCNNELLVNSESIKNQKIEDFAIEIIHRIKTLQEKTPVVMNEKNKNLIKNQKMVKKKAFIDLLKELKRIGLRPFIKKKTNEKLKDLVGYMFRLGTLRLGQSLKNVELMSCQNNTNLNLQQNSEILKSMIKISDKADDYYYRIIAKMSCLCNLATSSPSKDLTLQEVHKGLGFSQDLLSLIVKERKYLHNLDKNYIEFSGVVLQFSRIYSNYNLHITHPKKSLNHLNEKFIKNFKIILDDIVYLLSHSCLIFDLQKELLSLDSNNNSLQGKNVEIFIGKMQNWLEKISLIRDEFIDLYNQIIMYPEYSIRKMGFITNDLSNLIQNDIELIKQFYNFVKSKNIQIPEFSHILEPLYCYLFTRINNLHVFDSDQSIWKCDNEVKTTALCRLVNDISNLLDRILVAVQELRKAKERQKGSIKSTTENDNSKTDQTESDDDKSKSIADDDGYIRQEHEYYLTFVKKSQLSSILPQFNKIQMTVYELLKDKQFDNNEFHELLLFLLQRLHPFIHQYNLIILYYLSNFIFHHKSLNKLTYVLCDSFTTIFQKGYCMPDMETENDGEECRNEMGVQGTGIGEGDGAKNVSDEIEDEEQVLGTQNESNQENQENQEEYDDKGIEMENDFEGSIGDLEEKNDNNGDDQSELSEGDSDLDENMGNVDETDPNAVDKKMWDDDSTENVKESKETSDSKEGLNSKDESDIVANENHDDSVEEAQKQLEKQKLTDHDFDDEQEEFDEDNMSIDEPEFDTRQNQNQDNELEIQNDSNDNPSEVIDTEEKNSNSSNKLLNYDENIKNNHENINDNKRENLDQDSKFKDVNPHRSLGDALEQWQRRLNVLENPDEIQSDNNDKQKQAEQSFLENHQEFEFLKNDENSHDLQAMGNALEEQIKSLGAFDDQSNHEINHGIEEDIEMDHEISSKEEEINFHQEQMFNNDNNDYNQEHGKEKERSNFLKQKNDDTKQEDKQYNDQQDVINYNNEPLLQEVDDLRQSLEDKLIEWRKSGNDLINAQELWFKYENLTCNLANRLCEQLRLILEPTLATKLKGDYRTGKRLNMKKIIPYIASDFKKDKIWLRRTKPSKRQYQVMIAVDDSKSMSETHSIQLAYEALALISKALSQLEVGNISIVSFGEKVQLLHPFDQPFNSEAGAQVLHQFTFEQNKTYIKSLMESTIKLLENARNNNYYGNGSQIKELWQLQIIISDGVCEDHESIKALVRKAVELQIMVVFIIIDNKLENDSIMSMNQVKYKLVDGNMTIQMERYLDKFPFDYYVVLKNINSLPETLADALRQYFTIISQNRN
nr:11509_t:CDS:10 [Entrophospora candida]